MNALPASPGIEIMNVHKDQRSWIGGRFVNELETGCPVHGTERNPEESGRLRRLISPNRSTPPATLAALAKQEVAIVLVHLAENPRTSAETLSELAGHPSAAVRAAVAENRNCPAEVLARLAVDEDVDVRYRMAENHHLSTHVLEILSEDSNPYVAGRAQRTLSRLKEKTEPVRFVPPAGDIRESNAI